MNHKKNRVVAIAIMVLMLLSIPFCKVFNRIDRTFGDDKKDAVRIEEIEKEKPAPTEPEAANVVPEEPATVKEETAKQGDNTSAQKPPVQETPVTVPVMASESSAGTAMTEETVAGTAEAATDTVAAAIAGAAAAGTVAAGAIVASESSTEEVTPVETTPSDSVVPAEKPHRKYFIRYPWYFSFGVGPQIYFGMNDSKMFFKDRVAPALKLTIGRRITNVIGLDLGFSAAQFRGVCSPMVKDAFFLIPELYEPQDEGEYLVLQRGYYMNLSARMTVDLTNWFGGVNPDRRSGVVWYVGGGWAHGFGCDRGANAPTINSGFIYNYYFTQRLALDIDLYGALVGSYFEGEHCGEHIFHGVSGFTVGISYRF